MVNISTLGTRINLRYNNASHMEDVMNNRAPATAVGFPDWSSLAAQRPDLVRTIDESLAQGQVATAEVSAPEAAPAPTIPTAPTPKSGPRPR